jgi:hypothetical protein
LLKVTKRETISMGSFTILIWLVKAQNPFIYGLETQ